MLGFLWVFFSDFLVMISYFLLSILTEFSANDHCKKDNYGLC